MATVVDLASHFDAEGRFLDGEGELDVVFATRGGERFPGRLCFRDGLCIRAEMEGGGTWESPGGGPLDGVRALLDLGGPKSTGVAIDRGRMILLDEARDEARKRGFLLNFRVARNLFGHPQVMTDAPRGDVATIGRTLARAAIWLTPKSVAGFDAADFAELGPARRRELQTAVDEFRTIAQQVPSNRPATDEQFAAGSAAFERLSPILEPYLAFHDEDRRVEAALRNVAFPDWIVNWDYQLQSDSDGEAILRVDVFADERTAPMARLGVTTLELTDEVRQALDAVGVERWPYIRVKTALEHKTGAR